MQNERRINNFLVKKPEHCKIFQEQILETDKDLFSERELVLRDIEKNNTRLDKAEAELEKTEDPARIEKLENDIRPERNNHYSSEESFGFDSCTSRPATRR